MYSGGELIAGCIFCLRVDGPINGGRIILDLLFSDSRKDDLRNRCFHFLSHSPSNFHNTKQP